jgi:hypothetical protein
VGQLGHRGPGQHPTGATELGRPPGQIVDCGPQLPGRGHRAGVVAGFLAQRAVVGVHHVAARERFGRLVRGPVQAERLEQPFPHHVEPRLAGVVLDQGAQETVREIRVVEPRVRPEGDLVRPDPGQQVGHRSAGVALPPRPVRLPLEAGRVAEQLPQPGPPDLGRQPGEMVPQPVVEVEAALVPQAQHHCGGQALGDGAEPELELAVRHRLVTGRADVGDPAVADDGRDQGRGPTIGLGAADDFVDAVDRGRRERHRFSWSGVWEEAASTLATGREPGGSPDSTGRDTIQACPSSG